MDPQCRLEVAIIATAGRLTEDRVDTRDAIAELRALVDDRTELLAEAAGGFIGSYLGHPLTSPSALAAAHLLVLACDGHHHDTLVGSADTARGRVDRTGYSL